MRRSLDQLIAEKAQEQGGFDRDEDTSDISPVVLRPELFARRTGSAALNAALALARSGELQNSRNKIPDHDSMIGVIPVTYAGHIAADN